MTTATGLLLVGTRGAALTLSLAGALYAIVGSGSAVVSYVEEVF